jgi:hypothetical protein
VKAARKVWNRLFRYQLFWQKISHLFIHVAGGEGGEAQAEEAAPAADAEDGSGEAAAEGESKRAEKPKLGPDDVKVVVDDFLTKISEDDKLASILFKDLAIPDRPKEADENLPPAEDD